MKRARLGMLIIASTLLVAFGPGCGGCDEDDESTCRSTQTTCVSSCDPLGGDYDGCVATCNSNLTTCLEDAGCT